MTQTGAKLKVDTNSVLTEEVMAKVKTQVNTTAKVTPQNNIHESIKSNLFYNVLFSDASPAEKSSSIAKELTAPGTKDEVKNRFKEFEAVKEYLNTVRTEMAEELVRLTRTDTFAILNQNYRGSDETLREFETIMAPFVECLDAIYKLRSNNVTHSILDEINQDKENEKKYFEDKLNIEREFRSKRDEIARLITENASLGEQKGWFGWGDVTSSAKENIARNEARIEQLNNDMDNLTSKLREIEANRSVSSSGEYANEKMKLRKLLDIDSEDHKKQHQALVDAASRFIAKAKEANKLTSQALDGMEVQTDNLVTANRDITKVYAILNQGVKEAENINNVRREDYKDLDKEENLLVRTTKEEERMLLDEQIDELANSANSTMQTYLGLSTQGVQFKAMKDAVTAQKRELMATSTTGMATVAEQMSSVLTSINNAAVSESAAIVKSTLDRMVERTNLVTQKEVIKNAMGIDARNAELLKSIDKVAQFGETYKVAVDLTKSGYENMRSLRDNMETTANTLIDQLKDSIAIGANINKERIGVAEPDKPATAPTSSSPFGLGKI